MANTKSALKAQRQSERRAARNRGVRSAVRTYLKKANAALSAVEANAAEVVRQAVSALDKAAEKDVIHRNKAARHKSQLMSRLNVVAQQPATEATAPKQTTGKPSAKRAAAPAEGSRTPRKTAAAAEAKKPRAATRARPAKTESA